LGEASQKINGGEESTRRRARRTWRNPKRLPARDLLTKQKSLESQRRASGTPPTPEESALDGRIRHWPRSPQADPYQAGLQALAGHVKAALNGELFAIAYNEFCAPTVEEAVEGLIAEGAEEIVIVPSMFTPGGGHSETDIPETLAALRTTYPEVTFRYAWPFNLGEVASLLVQQLRRF